MIFQVLDALGETIPCASYDSWMVYLPEGEFLSRIGPTEFYKVDSHYDCWGFIILIIGLAYEAYWCFCISRIILNPVRVDAT